MFDHGSTWFGFGRDLRPYPVGAENFGGWEMYTEKWKLAPLSGHVKRPYYVWCCVGCRAEVPEPGTKPQKCENCGLMYCCTPGHYGGAETVHVWKVPMKK